MVQFSLGQFLDFFRGLWSEGWPLLIGLGTLGLLLFLLSSVLFREGALRLASGLRRSLHKHGGWLLVLLAVALVWVGLTVTRELSLARLRVEGSAIFSRGEDPAVGETQQPGPTAVYLDQKTYTRTLTLPPDLLERIGQQGAEILSPYLVDPSSENVLKLADTFRRSGRQLIFSREATLESENALPLEKSDLKVNLDFQSTGANSFYNARFEASYAFSNPLTRTVPVRFTFPLPYGSGTLSEFQMVVNGKPYQASDLSSGYVWEGEVAAGATVTVGVRYAHKGKRGWSYLLTAKREPIETFSLALESNLSPKFARGSLFPTAQSRSGLTGARLHWNLDNVITTQDIRLGFEPVPLSETLSKVFSFVPAALLLALLAVGGWAWRRGLWITPLQALTALLGFGLGWAASSVLLNYLPPWLALPLGAALAIGLSARALGRAFLLPLTLASLTPLCFLLVGHAGLLLTGLGLALLLLLTPGARAPRTPPLPPSLQPR